MPKEVELEGTPGEHTNPNFNILNWNLTSAEATWAMITVLVVVIVVLVFCCLVPFYRALEKRYHHWEDEENDPRSEAGIPTQHSNEYFLSDGTTTSFNSPPPHRDSREAPATATTTGSSGLWITVLCWWGVSRLSVCSGEGSSVTTSSLNINNTFKNQSLLPR